MAFDQITHAVLESARAEAERARKAAEMAAAEKVRAARQASEADCERKYQAAVRAIDEELSRELTQIVGAGNKELLAERGRSVRRVFELAHDQILALPDEVHRDVMRRLLERATEGRGGRIRVHADVQPRFKPLIDELNAARAGANQLAIDESQFLPEPGGFIFVSDNYEVDQSVPTLLQDLEYELAPLLARDLLEQAGRNGAGS